MDRLPREELLTEESREALLRDDCRDWLLGDDWREDLREDCNEGLLKEVWKGRLLREDWMLGLLSDDWREGLLKEPCNDDGPCEWKADSTPKPSWVRVLARLPVLLPPLRLGKWGSSGSRGVGRGEGKCRLVRSGREPPVFRADGMRALLECCSGDGKILMPGTSQDFGREDRIGNFFVSQGFSSCFLSSSMFSSMGGTG